MMPTPRDPNRCESALAEWQRAAKELFEKRARLDQIKSRETDLKSQIKLSAAEIRTETREHQREMRERMSAGDCEDCLVMNGQVMTPKRASGWEIGGNLALGALSIWAGNRQMRHISDNNARLGFETQPYPSVLNGYPYFMNALYGATGGGVSGGAGCFSSGPNQGGAMGYPPGYTMGPGGVLYPSGMIMPGMNPMGSMNGPWGSAMCMSWPCPVGGMQGSAGLMIGAGAGAGSPWFGTPGFNGGFQLGGGLPNPWGMPGLLGSGQFGLGIGGGLNAGLGLNMGMDPFGMSGGMIGGMAMNPQLAQMQMQMQIQQQQQMMEMAQNRMRAQVAYQQQYSNLMQEYQALSTRLQMLQQGAYLGVLGSGSTSTTGSGTWSTTPGTGVWNPSQPGLPNQPPSSR